MSLKNNKIDIKEIKRKNKIVDDAIVQLKKEFVGIHKQIDEIMDNVRTWYLYPQLQTRPLVISIWGLSGIGKTSLVKRISELLYIEKDYVYWNFASISEQSSWEIENQIEEELSNEKSNRMFVYDEFQYAATINPMNHEERDNKSGLKPFWELLDSGLIHKRSDFWNVRTPLKVLDYMTKINLKCKMEIKDGVWVNVMQCLEDFKPYDVQKFHDVFEFDLNTDKIKKIKNDDEKNGGEYDGMSEHGPVQPKESDEITPFFIKNYYLEKIIDLHDTTNGKISDRLETYHKLEEMNCDQIIDFISDVYENARKGYDLKFNDSIIFVIGNLDEAYEMSFNVNPDMSPDQFRKITEKISIVDIKDALKNRFRNEQIARLGNIHVIYPSFSEQNFRDLIQMSLDNYAKEAYKLTGYVLEFDDTIKQIIYEEGVFPTHGTRPIFSTVHEIVKSKFPEIIRNITENELIDRIYSIKYTFDTEHNIIVVYCHDIHGFVVTNITFDIKLRLKKLRDSDINDEEQALCALHESGHFVMYAKLFGKMPEKLVSRTTDNRTGGFLMEDVDEAKKKVSKRDMLNEIKVLLGGYVAEKYVFGEEMTSGASNDLFRATQLASRVVRRFGMGSFAYVATNTDEQDDPEGLLIKEENQIYINREIKDIINNAENEIRHVFADSEWRKMLKQSALYLCNNSAMSKEKMKEIYDNVADDVKMSVRSDKFYHDSIENI
jgi:cell division protease FtsH